MKAPGTPVAILADNYKLLQDFILRQSGIVVDRDKHYLLESRLLPLAEARRLKSLNDLCNLLRAAGPASDVAREIVEAMTTHETLFFREPAQYDALRISILPALLEERKSARILSFWSAAASSGQEAYSLAIVLRELGLDGWTIQILATDLSTRILDRARQGRYLPIEISRGLPPHLLHKYFHHEAGGHWSVRDEIRRMVQFQQFDLRASTRGMGPFDVVFCRNVLIYFDQETVKRIIAGIRATLRPGGHLLLSSAENPSPLAEHFDRVETAGAVLFRLK
ncbi:MAG: protein-glutamate O-methyltransferase CheR [Bryobacteraceae bacterium]|nr:protein-glutamate O-methyltransferase CheR [Bryobacteraceae bacterium]